MDYSSGIRLLFWGLCCSYLYISAPLIAFSAACEAQIEHSFFSRPTLDKALSLNAISQSSWYLIYLELNKRTPQIHQLVELYTQEEKKAKLPKTSAERQEQRARAADRAFFQVLTEVLNQFQVSENVPQNIYDYLKSQQRAKLVACYGPYFSSTPVAPENKTKAIPVGDPSKNFELIEQRRQARMYAYDMRALLRKYNIAPTVSETGSKLDPQKSLQAKEGLFDTYIQSRLIRKQ